MTDVKIPIKAIVEKMEKVYDCTYEFDEKNLIRRYFIACLNLGYISPDQLADAVAKFAKKVKRFEFTLPKRKGLEYYEITDNAINVFAGLKQFDVELYDKTIFNAISEAVLGFDDEFSCVSNAISEMMAEKLFNMDVNGSRIIMPKSEQYMVGSQKLDLRAGYERHKLTLNLLKQLFICKDINENKLLHDMLNGSFDVEWSKILADKQIKVLLQMLEAIGLMDKKACLSHIVNPKEIEYIEKYQTLINNMFTQLDQNYFAFCALITTDDLRCECMKKFSPEEQGDM